MNVEGDDTARFEIVRAIGYLPTSLEQWRSFSMDASLPAGDALRRLYDEQRTVARQRVHEVFRTGTARTLRAEEALPDVGDAAGTPHSEAGDLLAVPLQSRVSTLGVLVLAHHLQSSLLPPMLPPIPGLEVATAYVAGGTGADVGGDFYDRFDAGAGRWVAVTGDVRGRGVDAAATTGLARHTVRAAAVPRADPSAVVRRLDEAGTAAATVVPLAGTSRTPVEGRP